MRGKDVMFFVRMRERSEVCCPNMRNTTNPAQPSNTKPNHSKAQSGDIQPQHIIIGELLLISLSFLNTEGSS